MHLQLLIILPVFMVITAASSSCDPVTQYEKDGECCLMCQPGTFMRPESSCQSPQCEPCPLNEYQELYTTDSKCQRQPDCGPNRNFKFVAPDDKKKDKKSDCICKEGFHCSSSSCLTCVQHRACKPGEGAVYKGNQTHDTVCKECPEGTFSDTESPDNVCKEWAECESGYHIKGKGTAKSDNSCEKDPRKHLGLLIAFVSLVGLALVVFVLLVGCKVKKAAVKKAKDCVETCAVVERQKLREEPLITFPTPDPISSDTVHTMIPCSPEDIGSVPEENEENGFTDNGNLVRQENGKSCIFPRQESQTCTVSQESSSITSDT